MSWLFLFVAGLLEICFVIGLKYSLLYGRPWIYLLTSVALLSSTALLSVALKQIPTGTAYTVWTGIGAIGSIIAGAALFAEPVNTFRIVCAVLIIAGIGGLKASAHDTPALTPASTPAPQANTQQATLESETLLITPKDAISELVLVDPIPRTPLQFLKKLNSAGLKINYHIVANGGAENTKKGSFSSFGTVEGQLPAITLQADDFTFGIFIEPDKNNILCVQNDFSTKLLIEVITTDASSGTKNFWELIGEGKTANWHFRTNSEGIAHDAARVNMMSHPVVSKNEPLFGNTARCSGCHINGNLVMKELDSPHNDWLDPSQQDSSQLIRGEFKLASSKGFEDPGSAAALMFAEASSPAHLEACIRSSLIKSIKSAAKSPVNFQARSQKMQLRCLFAPLEMNLRSDSEEFKQRLQSDSSIEIPSQFFVDERLSGKQAPITVPLALYKAALKELGSSFAADETNGLTETAHAFLFPTRSFADETIIDSLLAKGVIDNNFVVSTLAIDWTTPIFSTDRLALLESLPDRFSNAGDLKEKVLALNSSSNPKLRDLQHNLNDKDIYAKMKNASKELLATCRANANKESYVVSWIKLAAQRRVEIQDAQTAQNPRGTILEGGLGSGGFRRIFPQYKNFIASPHKLKLNPASACAEDVRKP